MPHEIEYVTGRTCEKLNEIEHNAGKEEQMRTSLVIF